MTLQRKHDLQVKVARTDGTAPAHPVRVTALEADGLGAAPTPYRTSGAGSYTLCVDPGAETPTAGDPPAATLLVEPDLADRLMAARVPVAPGATSVNVTLAPGLGVSGRVLQGDGAFDAVPSARVELYCDTCSEPLTTGVTDGSGVYTLYVPDPGLAVDMGGVD
jgi:hypothetical protein